MAEALAADSSESLTADLFDCAVCMEDMSDRKPKNLTCGHSFCQRCLENIIKGKKIICPTCRSETVLADRDVSSLPTNLLVSNVKEKVSGIIMKSNRLCMMCIARDRCTSATYVCQDCKVNMCDSCQEYHLKIDIFTDHIVTPLDSDAILCSAHNCSMDYLCLECKKNLCLHCTMHSCHESHTNQIKTLESAQEDMIDQAQKMRYVMDGIQKSAISLMYQPSLIAEDFSLDILILTNETHTNQFLEKWPKLYQKTQDMYEAGINLSSALDYYYLTITDKPEHKLPEMKTKPVHLITFNNHLGSLDKLLSSKITPLFI